MSMAIVTMVHNEDFLLDLWCRHYSKLDDCRLLVVDHGSDGDPAEHVKGRADILRLPRTRVDAQIETTRASFASALQNALIKYHDIVIYTDVDEFIVVSPDIGLDLHAYLKSRGEAVIAPIGLNLIHDFHTEGPLDEGAGILEQRATAVFVEHFCKPICTRGDIQWGPGFHTSKSPVFLDSALFLFHLNLFDRGYKLRRQKERESIARAAGGNVSTWGWTEPEIDRQFQAFLGLPWIAPETNFDFSAAVEDFRIHSAPGPDGFYVNRQRRGTHKHRVPQAFHHLL